jgi:hemolysin activation/secretion protein
VVALRAGGEKVWGDFPLQYAAFVGGGRSLRGYSSQRYAGDAAAWAGAELRQVLTRAEIVVRGDLGVLALADAGRVWYGGESDGGWHTAYGGGVFFSFMDHAYTASATYAYGEKGKLYLALGVPF